MTTFITKSDGDTVTGADWNTLQYASALKRARYTDATEYTSGTTWDINNIANAVTTFTLTPESSFNWILGVRFQGDIKNGSGVATRARVGIVDYWGTIEPDGYSTGDKQDAVSAYIQTSNTAYQTLSTTGTFYNPKLATAGKYMIGGQSSYTFSVDLTDNGSGPAYLSNIQLDVYYMDGADELTP